MPKTVLITGASTGIGRATAECFHERGWNVAGTMRSPEKHRDLAALDRVICPRLDVTAPDTIEAAFEETYRRFGAVDVVVNNAGYALLGPFEASEPEQIRQQIDTNVIGVMSVTRAVLPHFRERRQGVLVNISSVGGRVTFPLYSVYHATKWAVEGFSESLQYELRPFGIRVKIVEPGPIKTDFYDRSVDMLSKEGLTAYDAYVDQAVSVMNGFGERGASPERVARVIFKAATDGRARLRYGVSTMGLPVLRRLLPYRLIQAVTRGVVER